MTPSEGLVDSIAASRDSGPSRFGGTVVSFEPADTWPSTWAES
ncbi:hypothetical protein ACFXAE_20065 [Streptomyces sp. NPDC059454]